LLGQGVVWYSGQFWALYFLQTVKKLDVLTSSYMSALRAHRLPYSDLFGWLSDNIGRKPVILGGMLLAALTYYPLTVAGEVTNPGASQLSTAIVHHIHPGVLRRHGVRARVGAFLQSISK